MGSTSKKFLYFLTFLFIFSAISSQIYANEQSVFGPKDLKIRRWHIHFSFHKFKTDDPGDGVITITKNSPNKKIRGGFIIFNRKIIRIRKFLRGNDTTFEKDISLRSKNRMMVFLRGKRGASINIEVRKKASNPPPEITFSADPPSIKLGDSSTLTWTTTNADNVSIDQEIGEVSLNGSYFVSLGETTTYTLTATGAGGTTTETVTVTVHLPPTVNISADPETIQVGESSTLTWTSNNVNNCAIEPNIGSVDVNGSISVSPTQTITYTITVEGPVGTAAGYAEVIVIAPPDDVDYGLYDDEQQGGGGLVGESIRILNGNSVEVRSDLQFPSANSLGLSFQAFYNSGSDILGSLGYGWTHTYEASLDPSFEIDGNNFIKIIDTTGRVSYFLEEETGVYKGVFKELSYIKAEDGVYIWYRLDGTRYAFSASGRLTWIEDEKENRLELTHNSQGHLETVTDTASGRMLTFSYNADARLENISGPITEAVPSGIWVNYSYDTNQNLTSITYADGSGFNYTYSDPNDVHNLTEKRNKLGHLLNTWTYNEHDQAIGNFSVQGKGVSISYVSETQVDVTDAYGTFRTYTLSNIDGRKRVIAMQEAACTPYSNTSAIRWVYDKGMNLIEVEYAGGTINQYQDYDDRGNPGTVKIAVGTPEEKVITYTYHPDMNGILTRTEASVMGSGNKETILDYDSEYNYTPNEDPTRLISRIIERGYTKDTSGDIIPYDYITMFTYNSKGQVLTIDGPLPGSGDTNSFAYDTATGDLLSITRPLIGGTYFSDYDTAGRPGRVADVNGQPRGISYNGRGRITAIINDADGSATTFSYNIAGKPDSVTDPDVITQSFDYDTDYGRLIRVTDHESNYITYGYDAQGNRTEMSYHDPSGNRTFWKRYTYQQPDMPGKLWRVINPDNTFTEYGYDIAGNISSMADPKGHTTGYNYDHLNRLITVTQPGNLTTSYSYNTQDRLTVVTDAEGHKTIYEYDDMGRVISTTSPDTATVTYLYDEAGNLIKKTDAKGITVTYTYDLLNRLTDIHFPDSTQDITYAYDQGTYGTGRLTGITDPSGNIAFTYDKRGSLLEKTSIINGHSFTLTHDYTPGNRLSSITYPTGRTVTYNRNSLGRIAGVSTTYNEDTTTLINNLSYLPFGPAKGMDMGGSSISNVFDELYRMTAANPGAQTERIYDYDANGNITSIQVTNNPWKNQNLAYDPLNRLIEAGGIYGTISYTYDKVGNRFTRTVNDQTEIYTYITGTSKLDEVTGPNQATFTYDANGNTTGMGNKTFIYNQNNRLIRSEENGTILGEYTCNGLGQRVIKQADVVATLFHYDLNGNLIAESLSDGTFTSEYIYMGNSRLAKVNTSDYSIYYYLNDHLGTPQIMTDASGTAVWEATYRPFGEAGVNPNSSVMNNFRLPGQYLDQETGLHYNYFRDYHPGIGRYVEPDPIGLKGGINLYAYCFNDPINAVDPSGQFGVVGIVVGGVAGFWGGFISGAQAGNIWAGIAGGLAGGVIGSLTGFVFPQAGGLVGGIVGGFVGGAFGGGVGKTLKDPHASTGEKLLAMAKGAGIGTVTGAIVGAIGATAAGIETLKVGVNIGAAVIATPIGCLLEVMTELFIGPGTEGNIGPTIPETYEYPPDWFPEFKYDPNNQEEIDPNSSVTINVIGGIPPYTWSVSGNGFGLSQIQTNGLSNTLHADDTACGTATIIMTDACSQTVTGYVRCTSGRWETVETLGQSSVIGEPTSCIIGGYRFYTMSISWSCNCWDYQLYKYDYDKCVNCFNSGVHFGQLIDNPCTGGDVYAACSYNICVERNNRNARLSQWFRQAWVCD